MMNLTKRNILAIKGYLVILLFAGYYTGTTMFYHVHLIDGVVISHSHPYWPESQGKNVPYQTHPHSRGELTFIKYLNHLLWESGVPELSLPFPYCLYLVQKTFIYIESFIPAFNTLPFLRAPPAAA